MLSTSEHAHITLGDLTFDVTTSGPADGAPVVLLHGFPESAASWEPVSARLNESGLRTYAPNQRGYSPGARPDGVDSYRIDHLVADVIGLLDALDLDTAHLVGHDWGAAVAWVVAARHPDRINSLTTVSVPHPGAFGWALREDADQKERSSYIRLLRMEGKAERVLLDDNAHSLRAMFGDVVPPALVDRHVALLSEPGALTAALNWYRAMTSDFEQTPAVTVPTTYVWSTGDQALGRAGAERCGEFVDAPYEFVVLDGATHWIPEQRPDALADAILMRAGTVPN
ncbi:alpha/beta fold hydrolase [Rhodococcus opacus]|uniref:Alpha/beta hydrolase n=1 Tax=Rhodococcus opacus TaxID=37919 RepID=A0AAX3YAB7_RHOOP|nr:MULTISPECIES: alpha/beta hydrolase [Rhodococcus]ELB89016.1 haloalkane dehalogenase [Rhodococcus wratislaviensis IFP 2016]NHU44344.1 alpha/beta hydrolase [Rhodococcus sp. A14]MCZ4588680.1 alpha/beta hydrolase [Rhodococcus opacus]MDI9934951.1 alpha/beta hydrolase [Rhodococcus sp. IEGM 1351]MDJ0419230.1 alpha/beta hydrolase [Rhodococcus opacus]